MAARKKRRNRRMTYRGKGSARGSGHRAGYDWAGEKEIDPNSRVRKYSKNSPSFDEGVWVYKENVKGRTTTHPWQFAANAMPFASEAQRRFMHSQHPEIARRWDKETPQGKLPKHARRKKRKAKQMSDDAPWWAAQFGYLNDVPRAGDLHTETGRAERKERYATRQAEAARDYEDEEHEGALSRLWRAIRGGTSKKSKRKLARRAGVNRESLLNKLKPPPVDEPPEKWTPPGQWSDAPWWQAQFSEAMQFRMTNPKNSLPPRGQHKPAQGKQPPTDDMLEMGVYRRYRDKGQPDDDAIENTADAVAAAQKRTEHRRRFSFPSPPPRPPSPPGPRGRRRRATIDLSEDTAWWATQFNEDWGGYEEPNWRGEPEIDPYHFRGESAEFDRPDVGDANAGLRRNEWYRQPLWQKPPQRIPDEDIDELSHHQKMQAITERLEAGGNVHPQLVQELLDKAAHIANHYMYPAGPTLGGAEHSAYSPEEGYDAMPDDEDQRMHTAYRLAAERMLNAWHKRQGSQMSEAPDEYQGRLVKQFPSMYQPIQFGEQPPNLKRSESQGVRCASCKHFKPAGGKEVDDQGRCALYDYVVKARLTCDAWTPTKEQQEFRGPGVMLDRKGGDPQHGGTSQMAEPIQFRMNSPHNARQIPPVRGYGAPQPPPPDPQEQHYNEQGQRQARESRIARFFKKLTRRQVEDVSDATQAGATGRQEARDQKRGFSYADLPKPGPALIPKPRPGPGPQPRGMRPRRQPYSGVPQLGGRMVRQAAWPAGSQMSEEDYFAGYEEHLLKTMPERFQ